MSALAHKLKPISSVTYLNYIPNIAEIDTSLAHSQTSLARLQAKTRPASARQAYLPLSRLKNPPLGRWYLSCKELHLNVSLLKNYRSVRDIYKNVVPLAVDSPDREMLVFGPEIRGQAQARTLSFEAQSRFWVIKLINCLKRAFMTTLFLWAWLFRLQGLNGCFHLITQSLSIVGWRAYSDIFGRWIGVQLGQGIIDVVGCDMLVSLDCHRWIIEVYWFSWCVLGRWGWPLKGLYNRLRLEPCEFLPSLRAISCRLCVFAERSLEIRRPRLRQVCPGRRADLSGWHPSQMLGQVDILGLMLDVKLGRTNLDRLPLCDGLPLVVLGDRACDGPPAPVPDKLVLGVLHLGGHQLFDDLLLDSLVLDLHELESALAMHLNSLPLIRLEYSPYLRPVQSARKGQNALLRAEAGRTRSLQVLAGHVLQKFLLALEHVILLLLDRLQHEPSEVFCQWPESCDRQARADAQKSQMVVHGLDHRAESIGILLLELLGEGVLMESKGDSQEVQEEAE